MVVHSYEYLKDNLLYYILMSKKIDLIYKLDGDGIEDGVNVFELAPILLSLGELIKEANKISHPGGRDLAVNVKPFEKGSFVVDIVLFAQSNYQEVIDFVNLTETQELKELLEWIGIISGSGVSVMWLIKQLKGKPKTVEQIRPNEVRYTDESGNTFTVNNEVHALFSNTRIQQHIYTAYGRPFQNSNIEQLETYLKEDKEETREIFLKNEVLESIQNYSDAELPSLIIEEDLVVKNDVFVSPKRGSFDADPRQWSFRMGGDQVIKATIKDEEFLERNRKDMIRIHFTDVLKVRLIQHLKKRDGIIDLDSGVYEVEKVLEYFPGKHSSQGTLVTPKE